MTGHSLRLPYICLSQFSSVLEDWSHCVTILVNHHSWLVFQSFLFSRSSFHLAITFHVNTMSSLVTNLAGLPFKCSIQFNPDVVHSHCFHLHSWCRTQSNGHVFLYATITLLHFRMTICPLLPDISADLIGDIIFAHPACHLFRC